MPAAKEASRSRGASARSGTNGTDPRKFTVRGLELSVPKKVTVGTTRLHDEGFIIEYVQAVLGEDQMERVHALELPTGKLAAEYQKLMLEIVQKIDAAVGIDAGE